MAARAKVLVTARTFQSMRGAPWEILEAAGLEVVTSGLDRPLSGAELRALLPGIVAVIVGMDEVSAEALEGADALRVVSMNGVGLDRIDVAAAARRGIAVTNTPGTNAESVADLTMALILALMRRLPQHDALLRLGLWKRTAGRELGGQLLGLVGLGRVGKAVAVRARSFGLALQVFDPYLDLKFCSEHEIAASDWQVVLATSDILSLHLPVTADTAEILNETTLAQMKPGAVVINTARGELIDEPALVAALASGHLGGAALDVFSHEPPIESALWKMDNVVLSPHLGGNTREAAIRTACQAARNVVGVLTGGPVDALVSPGK